MTKTITEIMKENLLRRIIESRIDEALDKNYRELFNCDATPEEIKEWSYKTEEIGCTGVGLVLRDRTCGLLAGIITNFLDNVDWNLVINEYKVEKDVQGAEEGER